jgi:hypothetical protein
MEQIPLRQPKVPHRFRATADSAGLLKLSACETTVGAIVHIIEPIPELN